jgi:beta-lactamase class A
MLQNNNLNDTRDSVNFVIGRQKELNNITYATVYYRDLNNGPWFGINEKEYFSPASLIKVPLMIAYYKLSESDPSILDKEIDNTIPYNPSEQNITPTKFLELNQKYTINQLIDQMIIQSDNVAYEILLNNIDNSLVSKVYEDLGVDISKAKDNPNGNILRVKDYAAFFRILYNASYLERSLSEKALYLLSQSTYHKGLSAGVPENIVVSHKFGERRYLATEEHQLHDCGIIYSSKNPYLLCVMTRGEDFNKLANSISQISKTVYDKITTKK